MKPRKDAERVRPSFINVWTGDIIANSADEVIYTLIVL